MGAGAMNDILELWSVPWHALQKNLAEAFDAGVAVDGVGTSIAALQSADAQKAGAGSWLGRAHNRMIQVPGSIRRPLL